MRSASRILFCSGFAALVACSIAEIPGTGPAPSTLAELDAQADALVQCIAEPTRLEKVDLSTLQACQCKAGGRAHCIEEAKLPATLARPLAQCQGTTGRCVPDAVIESGGEPFPTCKTQGDEGRCVTLCVPRVDKYAEALTRGDGDTCKPDEKCVPCKMPDGSSSGICEVGTGMTCVDGGPLLPDAALDPDASFEISCPYTGTPMSVVQMPACAPGGRCVSEDFLETAIPDGNTLSELKARLDRCAFGYCVPEDYLLSYGQFKPVTCTSLAGIEGRCFSTVFKDVDAQKDLLPQDTCDGNHRCIPCFNPADGAPSGACTTVKCDQPATTVPPTLQDCCSQSGKMRGKCIPREDIPEQFRGRLTWYECDSDTELCVPSENVDLKSVPAMCTPVTSVPVPFPATSGVCVSRCLVFSFLENFVFQRAGCAEDEICAPCNNPANNQPTGAPGCKN